MRDEQRSSGLPRGYESAEVFSASHWEGPLPPQAARSSLPVVGRQRRPRPLRRLPHRHGRQPMALLPRHRSQRLRQRSHRQPLHRQPLAARRDRGPCGDCARRQRCSGRQWHRPASSERGKLPSPAPNVPDAYTHAARALQIRRGHAGEGRQGFDHQGVAAATRRCRTIRTSGGRNSRSASARRWTSRSCRCRNTPRRRRR